MRATSTPHSSFDRLRSPLRDLVGRDRHRDAARLAGGAANQPATLKLDDHPMDGRRAGESIDIGAVA